MQCFLVRCRTSLKPLHRDGGVHRREDGEAVDRQPDARLAEDPEGAPAIILAGACAPGFPRLGEARVRLPQQEEDRRAGEPLGG